MMVDRLSTDAARAVYNALAQLGVAPKDMRSVLGNVVRDFSRASAVTVEVDGARLAALQDVTWFNTERLPSDHTLVSWGRLFPMFMTLGQRRVLTHEDAGQLEAELVRITAVVRQPTTRVATLSGAELRHDTPVVIHDRAGKAERARVKTAKFPKGAVHCVVRGALTATPLQLAQLVSTLDALRMAAHGAAAGGVDMVINFAEVTDDG